MIASNTAWYTISIHNVVEKDIKDGVGAVVVTCSHAQDEAREAIDETMNYDLVAYEVYCAASVSSIHVGTYDTTTATYCVAHHDAQAITGQQHDRDGALCVCGRIPHEIHERAGMIE